MHTRSPTVCVYVQICTDIYAVFFMEICVREDAEA